MAIIRDSGNDRVKGGALSDFNRANVHTLGLVLGMGPGRRDGETVSYRHK